MTDARKVEKSKSLLHWYRRLVDLLSFVILACIIITAIYCVEIRMHYERSYIATFVIGLVSLAVMLIAWGQQVIAAAISLRGATWWNCRSSRHGARLPAAMMPKRWKTITSKFWLIV
jgi:archaellum biogenesis protein FlaJ (TadC family)